MPELIVDGGSVGTDITVRIGRSTIGPYGLLEVLDGHFHERHG